MGTDSFVFYRSFATAAKKMPGEDRLALYDGITAYCLDGTSPELSGVADMAWDLIKPQLDANRKRREDGMKGGDFGKLGGRPKNPIGVIDENPSGDLDNTPNVNGNHNVNLNGNCNGVDPQTLPPINLIIEESRKVGFNLDSGFAQKIAESGIDPSWLTGEFNYCQYAKERIEDNSKYASKPMDEKRRLYAKSFYWEDHRSSFPAWQAKQRQNAEGSERERQIKAARDNKPVKCRCGSRLEIKGGGLVCNSCKCFYSFDPESMGYVYNELCEGNFMEEFNKVTKGAA